MDSDRQTFDRWGELRILRIYIEEEPENSQAIFEIIVRGEQVGRLSTTVDRLGLAAENASGWMDPAKFSIPRYVKRSLQSGFRLPEDRTPVWIDLAPPAGSLAMIPWERVLRPEF